jgi:hypothetical protein
MCWFTRKIGKDVNISVLKEMLESVPQIILNHGYDMEKWKIKCHISTDSGSKPSGPVVSTRDFS